MRARIEDVAVAAGVSMKTVSRVMNGEANVREGTRLRVTAAMEKLNYRPDPSARRLAGQRSYEIVLAYNNPSRNYLMDVVTGVLAASRSCHYNLVLSPISSPRDIDEIFVHAHPDGAVLTPPLTDDPVVIAALERHQLPYSCLSPLDRIARIGAYIDDVAAARSLVLELAALGHRRIGHICGAKGHGAREWRLAGYKQALKEVGLPYDRSLVVSGEFLFESGVDGARTLLGLKQPPTAIFAANDDTAAGVLRTAAELGLRVPHDLSVCGFDDTPVASQILPALTTVQQPITEMARIATLQLIDRIRDPKAGAMEQVDYRLIQRESVGPAP
ncbi:LacI family DNA-binding transcriptional regulator [Solilutibacter silvestris]|uniref:Transcriptional regulator n=1 Tax=Solilutibacter silvestris TaxID=1645665 RepID=A0A2K1PX34_9GAMM|nr:LacI family DNA-binding transcriptional regulator [Lysobacter silvestris]PNS07360.1 Transcriptional regulator [Lysobacter silvestris]